MRSSRVWVVVLAALVLMVTGSDAFAKMGKGSSFGSRSTRTYDRPIERTVVPPAAPVAPPLAAPAPVPSYAPSPGLMPQSGGSFFQRHPFASGFMGGLVGAGIGSMLFGHSAYAMDASPEGGILGLVVQLALVGGLVWLAFRLFRGGLGANAQGRVIDVPYQTVTGTPRAVARVEKEFEPTDTDKQMFAQILIEAQRAWTASDIGALKQIATPEVVSYLADDMAADSSKGVRNVIEDVRLLKGDIIESWTEGNRQFVTAAMTFTNKDYTLRLDNGGLVEGNPNSLVENTEAWTFMRVGNGRWLLSAVER